MTTALLFYVGFSINNATYGQLAINNANGTVSDLNLAPENEAIVAIPTPSAEDFIPETDQQVGTKEKVLENSDENNGVGGKVEQAEIQKDKVSESDQTSEEGVAQVSESEEKEDDSDAAEEENDNDNDVPFVLPFP
jgi:hypothetical protein